MVLTESRYEPGTIWFIERYNFGAGTDTRDKYCIILKVDLESELVCFCLTTTRKRYPSIVYPDHGCNPGPNSHYMFAEGVVVGKNDSFSFRDPTHVYHAFDYYLVHYSELEVYEIDDRVYIQDILLEAEFQSFYNCVKTSDKVARKIKRFL